MLLVRQEPVVSRDDFYVYRWINRRDGRQYIGKGVGRRCYQHVLFARRRKKTGSLLVAAMRQDGINGFELEMLFERLTEAEAFRIEEFLIKKLKTNVMRYGSAHGYNKTDGGEGPSGMRHSLATRQKLSQMNVGKKKLSVALSPEAQFFIDNSLTVVFLLLGLHVDKKTVRQMFDLTHDTFYRSLRRFWGKKEQELYTSHVKVSRMQEARIQFLLKNVATCKFLRALGASVSDISQQFDVSRSTVYKVLR